MPDFSKMFEDLGFAWFIATKERLTGFDAYQGLIDHGLFADKIPPCFTSDGLGSIVSEKMDDLLEQDDEKKLRSAVDKRCHDYVRYESLRDVNIPRHLGVPHPESYAVQVLVIQKYWKDIALHCNRPSPTFSRIHVRHVGSGSIFEMNYKGPERYQYEEEELLWMSTAQYVVKTDITSCFPSIYTHSIPWALHGKETAKKSSNCSKLYGNLLDKCTQNTKDKQTNGILIGPHTSNIISEIILTSVDCGLQDADYNRVVRHIDDYTFYAESFEEAEKFIRELGVLLRGYEMSLSEKKTAILKLPRPSAENWIHALNRYSLAQGRDIKFATVRSFLDLALELSISIGKSTPLNYAIKTLSGWGDRLPLNQRAKRLYTQEAINLALAYPYLAPLLGDHVFDRYWFDGIKKGISRFSAALVKLGLRKLYPDAIAYALYYALRYGIEIELDDYELCNIINLDDCISNVLLHEYASRRGIEKVCKAVAARANEIKKSDAKEKDRNWLLIYQLWSAEDLSGNGQSFLSTLKRMNYSFLKLPEFEPVTEKYS